MSSDRGIPRLHAWSAVLLLGCLLIGLYFALPSGGVAQSCSYDAIGFGALGAIFVGVRMNRPANSAP
jgi:hypothetical protein